MSLHIYFAVSILTLILLVYTQTGYEQSLFDKSLDFIPKIQEGSSKGDFKVNMWSLYSNVGLGAIQAVPVIACLLYFKQRARCFYYVFVIGCITLATNVTKLYYHQARPFWAADDI